jgi:hypothetical protein
MRRLAYSTASIGDWEAGINLLESYKELTRPDVDIICDFLRLPMKPDEVRSLVDRLVKLAGNTDSDERVGVSIRIQVEERTKVLSEAAQVLASVDPATSQTYASQAAQLCLPGFPEGNTDGLRRLLAIALHEDSNYSSACAVTDIMKWPINAIATYIQLIKNSSIEKEDVLISYAEAILRILRAIVFNDTEITELEKTSPAEARALVAYRTHIRDSILRAPRDAESSSYEEGIALVGAQAVQVLSERSPDKARALCDYMYKIIGELPVHEIGNACFICYAAEAAARTRFDRTEGLAHFDKAIQFARNCLTRKVVVTPAALKAVFQYLGAIAPIAPAETLAGLEQTRSLANILSNYYPTVLQRIALESAYAAALARAECVNDFETPSWFI